MGKVLVSHALAPCSLTWTRGDLQVVARPRRQGHRERQPRCGSHPSGGLQGTLAYCGPLAPARPILRESSGLLRPDALPHGCPQGTPRRGPLARRHARRSLRCDLGRPHAPGHGPPRAARRSGGVPRKPPTTPRGGRSRGPDPTCFAFSKEYFLLDRTSFGSASHLTLYSGRLLQLLCRMAADVRLSTFLCVQACLDDFG
mmetsp:Transcript_85919/g.241759  ORF Transcript_85919/g.241759 Transcript_85919/m.241759 type:complete len:200 (+) Transcript_85919:373-972(+)